MLVIWAFKRGISYFDVVGQYYVVSAPLLLLGEIVRIPVLEYAAKGGLVVGEVDFQFVFDDAFKCSLDRLVFQDSASGYEPKILCRGVFCRPRRTWLRAFSAIRSMDTRGVFLTTSIKSL